MASAGTASVDIELNFDNVQSDVDAAIAGLEPAPIEVPVDADVSEVESALAGLEAEPIDIPVSAEVEEAEAEIAGIESEEVVVPVTADTEDAQAQVDGLAESTGQLGGAAAEAAGGLGDLAGAGTAGAGAMSALGVGTVGASAALGEMITSGIEAASAIERFELVTGDLAGELSSINVGGLSGDIGDLALQIGSSDEAMLHATSTFVTFAEGAGASSEQIVETSDNINALALRAAALNPALGDAGAVAERMTTAFGRGGRALVPFGISLTSAEINARAMADTGKTVATELTMFEKAAAGAAIATERLGSGLGDDFAEGAENSALKMERLKESVGELAETAGTQMLPAVDHLTAGLTKLTEGAQALDLGKALSGLVDVSSIGTIANGLDALGDQLNDTLADVGGMDVRAASPLLGLTTALGLVDPPLKAVGGEFAKLAGDIDETASSADQAAAAIGELSAEIDEYLGGLFSVPDAQQALRQSFSDLSEAMNTGTWDDQADAMQGVVADTAALIDAQNAQGASQADLDMTVFASIATLNDMAAAGQLTTGQVATLTEQILGVPRQASTEFKTPGVIESSIRAREHKSILDATPREVHTWARVDVSRGEFDRLVRDLDAADNRRFSMQVSVNGPGRYDGGPVPGGPNEAVPMTLHGGEYVLSSDVVERIKSGRPSRGAEMSASGGGGGGGGTVININFAGAPAFGDEQRIVDALTSWSRANGAVPIRVAG